MKSEMADPKGARTLHSTGTKYELQYGYSRAVRQGNTIRVSGTAGLGENGRVVSDGVVEQMRRSLDIVKGAIEHLGGTLEDVIMTRIYVSDVHNIDSVATVHGEVFRDSRPASSIVKVEFIDPTILVEVEAEALLGGKREK